MVNHGPGEMVVSLKLQGRMQKVKDRPHGQSEALQHKTPFKVSSCEDAKV